MEMIESDIITICIKGDPYSWAAPRVTGRVTYNPKSRQKRDYIWQVRSQYREKALEGAISVDLRFFMPIPSSWSIKRKNRALNEEIKHTSKPDIDNMTKAALDALKGIVFKDDNQICEIHAKKSYSEKPMVIAYIRQIQNKEEKVAKKECVEKVKKVAKHLAKDRKEAKESISEKKEEIAGAKHGMRRDKFLLKALKKK
jgi:Holliday junction resolvase RusA-like endonuclease